MDDEIRVKKDKTDLGDAVLNRTVKVKDDIKGIVEKSTVPSDENEAAYATDEATSIAQRGVTETTEITETVGKTTSNTVNRTINKVQELRERRHQERYGNADESVKDDVDETTADVSSKKETGKNSKIKTRESAKKPDGKIKQKKSDDKKDGKLKSKDKKQLKKRKRKFKAGDKIKPENIGIKPPTDIIPNDVKPSNMLSKYFGMGGKTAGDIAKTFFKLLKKMLKALASTFGLYALPVLMVIIVVFNVYMYLKKPFSSIANVIDSVITGDAISDQYDLDDDISKALSDKLEETKKFETYNDMYHLYVQDKINACKDKYDELVTSEVEPDWDMLFKSFLVYVLTHNTSVLESDEIVEIKDADATFQKYIETAIDLTMTVKETKDKKILVVKARVLSKDELMEADTDTSFGYKNFYSVVEEYIGDTTSYTKDLDKYDHKTDYKEKLKTATDDGGEKESETETTEEETRRGGGGSFDGR